MCLFPVPFPLTPSLRPQVSSINPTVTRSLLYSVLRDAPSDRGGQGQQSRDAQLSEYPSLDYQGLYVTLVTLLDLVPLLQHGQHGESRPSCTTVLSSSSPSRLAAAWSHRCFFGLVCNGRREVPLRIFEGCMGWLGARWIDPVNLIAHKPLDTPHIGLLFCVSFLTACFVASKSEKEFQPMLSCASVSVRGRESAHEDQCSVLTSCCQATVHWEIMWEWLNFTMFFTGSKLHHSQSCFSWIFYRCFLKKAQKHESSSPRLECSTFPEGKLSSVAFIETSPPSAKHHIPSVLFPSLPHTVIMWNGWSFKSCSVAAYSMWILYVLCIEWASVHLSLCLSVHSPFLLRSGTVHILHYNLPPALSQWWYSQHFALYYDLHFSHIPPISSQRHHWVPEHLFSPHGYTWVPTLSPGKTGFPGLINHTVHEPKT